LAEQGLEIRLHGLSRATQTLHFVQSAIQSFGFHRLEKVIDGIFAEGLQGVLVVGRGENHNRLARQSRQNIEAGEARHLDIEEANIGRIGGQLRHGFLGNGGEPCHFHPVRFLEQPAQAVQRQRFIIHEIGT
jgi:hypothetical protein